MSNNRKMFIIEEEKFAPSRGKTSPKGKESTKVSFSNFNLTKQTPNNQQNSKISQNSLLNLNSYERELNQIAPRHMMSRSTKNLI